MVCNTCGRRIQNEEANFCEYCGSAFREHIQTPIAPLPHKYVEIETDKADKPVTFLNWLGSYGLMLIPWVGLAALFLWSFGKNVPQSKKNWARATLIFMVITYILLFVLMGSMLKGTIYQDILNGDLNKILSEYYPEI